MYHWKENGVVTTALTTSSVLCPKLIVREDGCPLIDGGVQVCCGMTVTTAAALFAPPQAFVTRTQYDVVVPGATVSRFAFAPGMGFEVFPDEPMYHWNENGVVPVALTTSSVLCPKLIVRDVGCPVIVGAVH